MSILYRAYKYRIYPNQKQKVALAKTFGCCRKIYNLMLSETNEFYKKRGKLPQLSVEKYFTDHPYLMEVDRSALYCEKFHLCDAFRYYFNIEGRGYPKFKSYKSFRKSYTTKSYRENIKVMDKGILLPYIGLVKAKIYKQLPDKAYLNSATVSVEADGKYYASILFKYEKPIASIPVSRSKIIGLDYKSDGLYMSSNGRMPKDFEKYFRKNEKKIVKAQRKLTHKVIGSKNYQKQQQAVAKIYKKISNQRNYYLHRLSTMMAKACDAVCIEDISLKEISVKGSRLGKSTMDNSYQKFQAMLNYKLAEKGKQLIRVGKYFPSTQICSRCGRRHRLKLSERKFICPCGVSMDRDFNAAINIKEEGTHIMEKGGVRFID